MTRCDANLEAVFDTFCENAFFVACRVLFAHRLCGVRLEFFIFWFLKTNFEFMVELTTSTAPDATIDGIGEKML